VSIAADGRLQALEDIATQLRVDSVRATTAAGSGHPTSSASGADLVAAIFFDVMRFDPQAPRDPACDRFVLSKGHAAPLLYAAWAAAGALDRKDLVQLRRIDSDLEGHPTPRLPFVDVATGSLGQGLGVGVGLALGARSLGTGARVFVLLGDGEMAEGSVWEAAQMASHEKLDNLVAVVDVNALGQSGPTMLGHDLKAYQRRFAAFGWRVNVIDGHDMTQITTALRRATRGRGAPTAIVARTLKGKGLGAEVEGLARERHRRPRHDADHHGAAARDARPRRADGDRRAHAQGQGAWRRGRGERGLARQAAARRHGGPGDRVAREPPASPAAAADPPTARRGQDEAATAAADRR